MEYQIGFDIDNFVNSPYLVLDREPLAINQKKFSDYIKKNIVVFGGAGAQLVGLPSMSWKSGLKIFVLDIMNLIYSIPLRL